MFCVDLAPCWKGPCHMLAWGYPPSQGAGQNTPGHWDCLRVNCGHVFANMVRYICKTKQQKHLYRRKKVKILLTFNPGFALTGFLTISFDF